MAPAVVVSCRVTHRPSPYSNLYSLVIFFPIQNKDTMGASTEHRNRMFSLIESWQQSALSQTAFCEQQPIAAHQFYYWHKIYRSQNDLSIAGVCAVVGKRFTSLVNYYTTGKLSLIP